MKMQQSLLPLLILTIVAVCSTKELPLLNSLELENIFENQDNDNTLNNRLQNRDTEKLFFKRLLNRLPLLKPEISNLIYDNKEDNGEGNTLSDRSNKDLQYDENISRETPEKTNDIVSLYATQRNIPNNFNRGHIEKEFTRNDAYSETNDNDGNHFIDLDSSKFKAASPLLILKIRLSYLTNEMKPIQSQEHSYTYSPVHSTNNKDTDENTDYDKTLQNEINSVIVKRDEADNIEALGVNDNDKSYKIKKRIFSLWSRLQGLHRGHELHHRRHLHAFYGLPDDGGGGGDGVLTAETRATFLRPPGSPLRWG